MSHPLPHGDEELLSDALSGWMEALCAVRRTGRTVEAWLDAQLAAHEIEPAAFLLLWACRRGGESLSQRELAEVVGGSPALVSGLVEACRRNGWLEQRRDPADRRRQCWRLTDKGRTLCDAAARELFGAFQSGRGADAPPATARRETVSLDTPSHDTLRLRQRLAESAAALTLIARWLDGSGSCPLSFRAREEAA